MDKSRRRLTKDDFLDTAEHMAQRLLGKIICRRDGDKIIQAIITETECYMGENDTACHACKGKTKRNAPMYLEGGHLYVYLCYGLHNMLNIVTGAKGSPEAVLIRGVEGANGPGRVTRLLDVTTAMSGCTVCEGDEIWIEDTGETIRYRADKRVGIDYAKEYDRDRLWRFILE